MRNNRFACPCYCQTNLVIHSLTSAWIQEENSVFPPLLEVEHLADRASNAIERSLANALSTKPVVFDEMNDRTLVSHGVIHKVLSGPRRDDHQRQSRSISATPKGVRVCRVQAWQRGSARPASIRPSQRVGRSVEVFTIGPIWWSYHPSESSYMITTAVLRQLGSACRKFSVFTRNVCSSRGSE